LRVLKIFTSFLVQKSSIFYEEFKIWKSFWRALTFARCVRLNLEKLPKKSLFDILSHIRTRAARGEVRASQVFSIIWIFIRNTWFLHQKRIIYLKKWQLNLWLKIENLQKNDDFSNFFGKNHHLLKIESNLLGETLRMPYILKYASNWRSLDWSPQVER